ncbi:MAG: hypothetical protein JW828_10425 [Sedimentisphaerales bacterium]|nr:hypothetical protein [Sedimentisphaerales bacterium]
MIGIIESRFAGQPSNPDHVIFVIAKNILPILDLDHVLRIVLITLTY